MTDLLIRNGLVVDGTGNEPFRANVAVHRGKISLIASTGNPEARRYIDATGLVVAPGFVDYHSHSDAYFLFGTDGYNMLEQGITTEIAGHCGSSVVPSVPGTFDAAVGLAPDELIQQVYRITSDFDSFSDSVSGMDLGTNLAFYVGHGSIRSKVMGNTDTKPSPEQMESMKVLLRQAMKQGFLGLSTGLIYPPSIYADTDEIVELAKVVAEFGGTYTSHIRGESDTVVEAVQEAIAIGERSGCNVIISHHKVSGKHNAGKSQVTTRLIEEANYRGRIQVYADHYPFLAGNTSLLAVIPPHFMTDGSAAFLERLQNQQFRLKVTESIARGEDGGRLLTDCGFSGSLVIYAPQTQELVGRNLAEIAASQGEDPYTTLYDIILANKGNVLMAYFGINEQDMFNILSKPYVMAGTDGMHNIAYYDPEHEGGAHPRLMSTFPRHLRLIRENNLFTLEAAVHRLTALPAKVAGLDGVGILREGYNADIVVFDYANLRDNNTFLHPFRRNTGIHYVVVNGEVAVENGKYNGCRAGRFLRRHAL